MGVKTLLAFLGLLPHPVLRSLYTLCESTPGYIGLGLRFCLVKLLVRRCGNNVYIARNVEIRGWETLELGDNVSLQRNCYVDAAGGITIGNEVSIAHATSLLSFEHTWTDEVLPIRKNEATYKAIQIEDDVWIGAGYRILSGVTIGTRCVVAAGAVVTRDVKTRSVVGGVPARLIKTI